MAKYHTQYWYRADVRRDGTITYIVSAGSVKEARIKLGLLAERHIIKALTWSEISTFTGCEIPSTSKVNEFAEGNLMFRRGDFVWYLWVTEIFGG